MKLENHEIREIRIASIEELCSLLYEKRAVYLYGAGFYCEQTLSGLACDGRLPDFRQYIKGILVSNKCGTSFVRGIPVIQLEEAGVTEDDVIILTLGKRFHEAVCEAIKPFGVSVCILDFNMFSRKTYDEVYRDLQPFIDTFEWEPWNGPVKNPGQKHCAFTLWWQGIEHAPELVKKCFESQRANLPPEVKHVVITEDNYREWIEIPEYILHKVKRGDISITTLSDIIRASLLYQYGGAWFDATLLITSPIEYSLFSRPVYSRNLMETQFCTNAMWAGWFVFTSQGYPLYHFVRDAFLWYFKHFDRIKHYLMIDYLTAIACNTSGEIEKDLRAVPYNNERALELYGHLMEKYEAERFEKYISASFIHKLSYKIKEEDFERKDTILAHLMSMDLRRSE